MKVSFIALLLFTLSASVVKAQDKYISFKNERIDYAPRQYYISDVVDDRADKQKDGIINSGGKTDKLMFANGAAQSLKDMIAKNLSQNKATQAIVLRIKKMNASITKEGAMWHVAAVVNFAFYAAGNEVIEYTSSADARINTDAGDYFEKFTRKTLESDLKKFDTWWQENKGKIVTNATVKVNVTVSKTTDKPNCIAYSLQRQLQIADFTGSPEGPELELAVTLSGIGVYYSAQTQNGQVVVSVIITPYFDRSRSWFKENGKNPRVLAHEQAHFDITAIKACELANAIRNTTFTKENYEKLINQMQQQNARDANDEESRYDEETGHGNKRDKQEEWQNNCKEKLKTIGCY